MKLKLIVVLLFLYPALAFCQADIIKKADSINIALSKAKPDTSKVRMYITQAKIYNRLEDFTTALANSEKGLELAKKLKWHTGIVESYAVTADTYLLKLDTKNGRVFLYKALDASKNMKDKSAEARIYRSLASSYSIEDYDKSAALFKKSYVIFNRLKMYKDYCFALQQAGQLHELKGNYYEAADCYRKLMIAGEKLEDKGFLIQGYNYMATMYARQGKYGKSREYLFKALKFQDKKEKDQLYGTILMQIGNSYTNEKQYDKALNYYTKGYNYYAKERKDKSSEASFALLISSLYKEKGDNKNVLLYIDKALEANKLIEGDDIKTQIFKNIGIIEFSNGNYEKALEYHLESLRLAKSLSFDYFVSGANGNVGATMVTLAKARKGPERQQLLSDGIEYLNKSLVVSNNLNSLEDIQTFSKYLSEAYEMQGNAVKAFEAYKQYIVYRDSVDNKGQRDEFTSKQFEYEYGKKEALLKANQHAEVAREQTLRNFSFAGIGVLLIVALGAGYGYMRKKKDNSIIEKEKKRSDDLLLNILPYEVAEELKDKGEAIAKYYEQVSIIFTDFEEFTKLSENMSPAEVIAQLNYCFKAFDNIITKYSIEKIKTIGDAYMAVSGLPVADPNHAINAVNAALEMRDFIASYKEERVREGKVHFEMRIGINSGEVVAGIVGIKKFAYDIWGDAVNVASRMETNGRIGKVNVSETTYNLIGNKMDGEYRGEIEVKGKGMVKMYFIEPQKEETVEFERLKDFILKKLEGELSPALYYHNVKHIMDVYNSVIHHANEVGLNDEDSMLLSTAALFHDSGFIIRAQGHEELSCGYAKEYLPQFGYNEKQISRICGMIMATKIPQSPQDPLEEIMADADLDYLGRDDFFEISDRLYMELEESGVISNKNEWNKIQVKFFEAHHYFTDLAKQSRKIKKAENLEVIKSKITIA